MKFGVVIHKPTMNLGDDIQTYAAAKLLPHVDYQIDREYISDFKSENDEPVAVIMNAWWMWKKWGCKKIISNLCRMGAGMWRRVF